MRRTYAAVGHAARAQIRYVGALCNRVQNTLTMSCRAEAANAVLPSGRLTSARVHIRYVCAHVYGVQHALTTRWHHRRAGMLSRRFPRSSTPARDRPRQTEREKGAVRSGRPRISNGTRSRIRCVSTHWHCRASYACAPHINTAVCGVSTLPTILHDRVHADSMGQCPAKRLGRRRGVKPGATFDASGGEVAAYLKVSALSLC
jgi:hypothetical protein